MLGSSFVTSTRTRQTRAAVPAYLPRHALDQQAAPAPLAHRGLVGLTVTAAVAAVVATMVTVGLTSAPSDADNRQVTARSAAEFDIVAPASAYSAARRVAPGSRSTPRSPQRSVPATTPVTSTRALAPLTKAAVVTEVSTSTPLTSDGIPVTAELAYKSAAKALATTDPTCGIPWPLLAGIGRVESDHGRFGGAQLLSNGTSTIRILGPVLNGDGNAVIRNTGGAALDGNSEYARAMGPMQFIPSTWSEYASDGNHDGIDDPFNIFDASLAAAKYLCTAGGDLRTATGQERAVFAYNHLTSYVTEVLSLERYYASGAGVVVPDGTRAGTITSDGTAQGSVTGGGASPSVLAGELPAIGYRARMSSPPATDKTNAAGHKSSGARSPKQRHRSSHAPVTKPPVTTPPVTTPPVTVPPVTGPPATVPPGTTPPVTVPPVTTAPVVSTCPLGTHVIPVAASGPPSTAPAGTSVSSGHATTPGTTASPTTAPSTTAPSTTASPTTASPTTAPSTTAPSTTAPPTTVPAGCALDVPATPPAGS